MVQGNTLTHVFVTAEVHSIKFNGRKVWLNRRHNAKETVLIYDYDEVFVKCRKHY